MAKQKNIKVVYQVDTSQVKAAEATVNKAKAATDNLTKSTKQLSDQSKAGGTQLKLTYEDIRAKMLAMRDAIDMARISDKKRLDELIPKYQQLKKQVDDFNRSVEGTAKSGAAAGVSLGGLYNSVRLALTAGLIRETANAAIQMTALAGKIEGVKRAFDKLPNSILLMEELKQRTHGALTELELMQKALQARNFGIPIENLGKLLEFAAIKSQQTGISIQYLTDSIVTGLGRESIKILDNLQIDIGKLKQRMAETGQSMRVVVGEIVNEELKKMGGYLETGETRVNRLKTAWSQLLAEVSKSFSDGSSIQVLTNFLEATGNLFNRGGGLQKASQSTAVAQFEKFREANKKVIDDRKEGVRVLEMEIDRLKNLHLQNTIQARDILHAGGDGSRMKQRQDVLKQNLAIQEEIKIIESYIKNIKVKASLDESQEVTVESLRKQVEKYNEDIAATNIHDTTRLKQLAGLRDQTQAYADALENLNRKSEGEDGLPTPQLTGDLAETIDLNKLLIEDTERTAAELKRIDDQSLQDAHDNDVKALKDAEAAAKRREQIQTLAINTAINAAHSVLSAWSAARAEDEDQTVSYLEGQLQRNKDYYDRVLETTGDNKRRQEEVQIEANDKQRKLEAEKEKAEIAAEERTRIRERNARLRQIAIDTAAGIVRALTIRPGLPEGGPIALFLAAEGIAQAAIVRKFKDGVIDLNGAGNETSDSIPARLSKHESVMTAAETKSSMNILKNIRARKLDDRIFEKLVVNGPAMRQTDMSPVVSELRKNRPGSIVTKTHQIYEVFETRKGLKQRIRNSSF